MADDAPHIVPAPSQTPGHGSAEQRLRLLHQLQTSQEPGILVSRFFQYLAPLLPFSGLEYHPYGQALTDEKNQLLLGKRGRHQCDYQLSCGEQTLGQFIFSRDQRFSEAERQWLEEWLGVLVLPLGNALRYQEALHLAMIDSLTGVGNRAALDLALHRELHLAERYKTEFSMLVLDVDHFKHVNDQFGHTHGDEVLKEVVQCVAQLCRSSDLLFRYGGEEFVILLSKTDGPGARVIAERVRRGVEERVYAGKGQERQAVTVSIGIGTRRMEGEPTINSLFDRADRALYQAKKAGRNRVITESPVALAAQQPSGEARTAIH